MRLYGLHPRAEHGVDVRTHGEVAGEAGQVPGPLTPLAVGTGYGGIRDAPGEMDVRDTVLHPHGGVALGAGLSRIDDVSEQTVLAEDVSARHALRVPRDLFAEATEQLHRVEEEVGPVASELPPGVPGQNHCSEYIVFACVHPEYCSAKCLY